MNWKNEFKKRINDFERNSQVSGKGLSISIKIKATYGCFHREHSPYAYRIIDKYLTDNFNRQERFFFQEHESGPEILVFLSLLAAGIQLSSSIIDFITTIIKAHSDGIRKGDRRDNQLELIIRYFNDRGKIKEERIVIIDSDDLITREELSTLLYKSTNKLLKKKNSW